MQWRQTSSNLSEECALCSGRYQVASPPVTRKIANHAVDIVEQMQEWCEQRQSDLCGQLMLPKVQLAFNVVLKVLKGANKQIPFNLAKCILRLNTVNPQLIMMLDEY